MRTSVAAIALLLVALTSGCTGSEAPRSNDETPSATPTDDEVAVVDSEACQEVRRGIDAFNEGDYAGTVEHFEDALPLAEEQDDGSATAGQLVDAVRYYAELRPGRYPEAARSSPDFARNKAITLGQCMPADYEPESPATDV